MLHCGQFILLTVAIGLVVGVLAVVWGVVDVGVGVDVIAPFSLSFILISDCDGILTMDGWTDGRLRFSCFEERTEKPPMMEHSLQYFMSFYLNSFERTNE